MKTLLLDEGEKLDLNKPGDTKMLSARGPFEQKSFPTLKVLQYQKDGGSL